MSKCSSPAHLMPQSSTRSGVTTTGEEMWMWAVSELATDAYTSSASDHCKHRSPTCFSTPLLWGKDPSAGRRKNTHLNGTHNQLEPDSQPSAPASWEQTPPVKGWRWPLSRAEVPPHTLHRLRLLHHQPQPLHQGDSYKHTLRKCVTGIHIKHSPPTKGTQGLHKDAST